MSIVTSAVFEPYAQALLSLGQSRNLTEKFNEDVGALLEVLHSSADLQQFLANPLTNAQTKKTVLAQVFGETLDPLVKNFLMLLVDRGRISFLAGICEKYQALLRKLNQVVLAEVVSTIALNEAQKHTVREKVIGLTGARQVDIVARLDPDLIGGVIIKVGSQVIDASLRGQLRRISLRLTGAV